jgi:hypothetical protein
MPNWTENKLTIENITPELEKFLKEKGLSFGDIVPPDYIDGESEASAQANAWGTKWDLGEDKAKEVGESLCEFGCAVFDTAWSPPIGVIWGLANMFRDSKFILDYHESGMGYYGSFTALGFDHNDESSDIGNKKEYSKFLVDKMDYDEYDADEAAGLNDEE